MTRAASEAPRDAQRALICLSDGTFEVIDLSHAEPEDLELAIRDNTTLELVRALARALQKQRNDHELD